MGKRMIGMKRWMLMTGQSRYDELGNGEECLRTLVHRARLLSRQCAALVDSSNESEGIRWTPGLKMMQNRTCLSFGYAVNREGSEEGWVCEVKRGMRVVGW